MILTKLEYSLRNRFFGLFHGQIGLEAEETVLFHIIQYIDRHKRYLDGDVYVPDQYLIAFNADNDILYKDKITIEEKLILFIKSYIDEAGYNILKEITVEIDIDNAEKSNGLTINGIYSADRNVFSGIELFINRTNDPSGRIIRNVKLYTGRHSFGRSDEEDIHLNHPFVSKHHFLMEIMQSGDLFIRDLNSVNGTYVDNNRLESNEWYAIKSNMKITAAGVFSINLNEIYKEI